MANTNKTNIIKQFAVSPNDVGSAQVQVALLTERIRDITGHSTKNPKDAASRKGLLKAVAQRRKFLDYLQKRNPADYQKIVGKLGLRK